MPNAGAWVQGVVQAAGACPPAACLPKGL